MAERIVLPAIVAARECVNLHEKILRKLKEGSTEDGIKVPPWEKMFNWKGYHAKTLGLKIEKLKMKHPDRKTRSEKLLKEKAREKEIAEKIAQFYES